jgi:predicted ferric reductase
VASSPREPVLRVFVKGLGGHTRQLLEAAEKHDHLRIRVDGPYGHVRFDAHPGA